MTTHDVMTSKSQGSAADEERVELATRTGFHFHVRPVGQADKEALAELMGQASADDLQFRFLTGTGGAGPKTLTRMSTVDHDRTENFVAFAEGSDTMVATAMLAADAVGKRAEVALAVRDGYADRGIGWTLLAYVVRYAEAHGLEVIESIGRLADRDVIELEQEMGFTIAAFTESPDFVVLEKRLSPAVV